MMANLTAAEEHGLVGSVFARLAKSLADADWICTDISLESALALERAGVDRPKGDTRIVMCTRSEPAGRLSRRRINMVLVIREDGTIVAEGKFEDVVSL